LSSLTVSEIAVHVRRRLGAKPADALRFQPLVAQALKSLAHKVSLRHDFEELQKEIAVTCTAGVVTLSDDSLLVDYSTLRRGTLLVGAVAAKPVRRYKALLATRDRSHYWYAVRNRKLYVADVTTGALGTAAGSGTLNCSYVPTLLELPPRYDEELIAEVVLIARGATGGEG
jgi:hypothetical protein